MAASCLRAQDHWPLLINPYQPPYSLVKCGNRSDLPKRQRRHHFRYCGEDDRTTEPGYKALFHIAMCIRCGVEKRSLAQTAAA